VIAIIMISATNKK